VYYFNFTTGQRSNLPASMTPSDFDCITENTFKPAKKHGHAQPPVERCEGACPACACAALFHN
jgi:hypothetical protein